MSVLSTPIQLGRHVSRNRIVMPPMVLFGLADGKGQVQPAHMDHYEARARGGAGLIVVEAVSMSKEGRLSPDQLGLWADDQIPGMSLLAQAIKRHGALAVVQINHAGRQVSPEIGTPLSAWDTVGPKGEPVRGMTEAEVDQTAAGFLQACMRAREAGFDGVEIHGAHGYLLCQFQTAQINRRTDAYGQLGRLPARIVQEVRTHWPEALISYRLGISQPLEDGIQVAKLLDEAGVDVFDVSSGIGDLLQTPEAWPYHPVTYTAAAIRPHVHKPVVGVYGIRTGDQAEGLVAQGWADMVAIGKNMLVDPEWANKVLAGKEPDYCLGCSRCTWFVQASQCAALRKQKG